jgi:hypothetical protein
MAACAALGLTACGGAGNDLPSATTGPDSRVDPQAATLPTPQPNAAVDGGWSGVGDWPFVAVHMAVLPDGRVLSFGSNSAGRQTGFFKYDVWDPREGLGAGHLTLDNPTGVDIFCSSQVLLPASGSIFIAGGDTWNGTIATNVGNNQSTRFDPATNAMSRGADMAYQRWYATSTVLLDGTVYVQGGWAAPIGPSCARPTAASVC